jgi:hypothetical protein
MENEVKAKSIESDKKPQIMMNYIKSWRIACETIQMLVDFDPRL